MAPESLKRSVRTLLPRPARAWVSRKRFLTCRPPVGWVRFGSLRRTKPISAAWGHDRGRPINRHYIESFVAGHAADIRGRVLEVADDRYTLAFGGSRVTHSDVLHATPGNPRATLVGDLATADHLPADAFDCVILTQVMQYIRDGAAAARHLHRILKPGGVVLVTLPGLEKVSAPDDAQWGDYWRFTPTSAAALFAGAFGATNVTTRTYGNVFAAVASLAGLSQEDVRQGELDVVDKDFPVVIAVRAHQPAR
jgi:SAM-dependent methyltransferase